MTTERLDSWAQSLRVGVTGHRLARLADVDLEAVAGAIRRVLDTIAAELPQARSLHLITNLAEGADSIAADAAIALGWRLDVVLPLGRNDYAADFPAGAAREAHHVRMTKADAVLELSSAESDGDRTAAYERAGRVVLSQSDILIGLWDGSPARGRGGAAQIIAEAVLVGIPVIHIVPAQTETPILLWDGLDKHDFGQQSIDSVPRGGMARLPELIARLTHRPGDDLAQMLLMEVEEPSPPRPQHFALAYPILLAVMGVRRLRRGDILQAQPASTWGAAADPAPALRTKPHRQLEQWFERADANAVAAGQVFRSAYVTNFSLAALAVMVSLSGLALPHGAKPLLAVGELLTILGILSVTRSGRRGQWHRRWLDQRHLAERLRCLLVASRLGELGLRRGRAEDGNWVTWAMRAAARMTGLPSARADGGYLATVRAALLDLLDRQIDYLHADAARMQILEHRMHRLGSALFGATAAICVGTVAIELLATMRGVEPAEGWLRTVTISATIASAALPACGAAIYGIRMQGEYAGIARRGAALATKLGALRNLVVQDPLSFDLLSRRMRSATSLLTDDVSAWLQTYRARPLTLPG